MDLPVRYYSTVLTQKMSSSSPRLSMRFIRVPGLRLSLKTMCGFAVVFSWCYEYVPSPGGFAETSQDTYDREPPTSLVFHSATQRG